MTGKSELQSDSPCSVSMDLSKELAAGRALTLASARVSLIHSSFTSFVASS